MTLGITTTELKALDDILSGELITSVYQPIVSLESGEIFGYEALSRISDSELEMNIEKMFRLADRANRSWELESLCRTKALEGTAGLTLDKRLFLNVNPNILYDEAFKNGFTRSRMEQYGLDFLNIIFEITERVAIQNDDAFFNAIEHYKTQNYGIAIDDAGAGYSGLNTIACVKPDFIKLDMALIRNIDKDETKQLLCSAMVGFCKSMGILMIAEGIETAEELAMVVRLGVDLGQGYYIGVPQKTFAPIVQHRADAIRTLHAKLFVENARSSVYPTIGHLSKRGNTFSPEEKAEDLYEMMRLNPTITEFTIVQDETAIGFMTKTDLNEMLGGRYGFTLNARKSLSQIRASEFLLVNCDMRVDQVSRLAMQRSFEHLYDPVVVEKDGLYYGIVTVKDLLNACTRIEVDIAVHSNPLTGLPGNLLIEKEIVERIFGVSPYCITYYDIDNFKAYNDAYGFQNGDMMLKLVAEVLVKCSDKGEFVGHIGGDDFVVIGDYASGESFCETVLREFEEQITSLYRDEDLERGFIVSKNRNGVTENFPIASLSVAGLTSRGKAYQSTEEFSNDIAQIKKRCKQQPGNYYELA